MYAISELVGVYNSADKSKLDPKDILEAARWVTSMVNIFGLSDGSESATIGWSGIDVPEGAKPYLYPLSTMRDSLRQLARTKEGVSSETVRSVIEKVDPAVKLPSEADQSYRFARVFADFRDTVSSLAESDNLSKEILSLCDRVRDVDLFDIGVYLEDRDNKPALVRPVTRELIQAREEKAARAHQKQLDKEKKEKEAREKAEKGRLSHLDMFRTAEYSAWDQDGLPTRDSTGEEMTKSKAKKLRKEWERQKKLHEAWLATNGGERP
jgi:cysteinyl-tRNA synthetase